MNILNVVPYWGPEFGGQYVNVANITANLILRGHGASIITTSKTAQNFGKTYPWRIAEQLISLPIRACKCYENLTSFSPEFVRQIAKHIREYDAVLIHGLWRFPTSLAAFLCRKQGIPYIVFTHAMMSPWSLSNRRIRKKIYFYLCEKNDLNKAARVAVMDDPEKNMAKKQGITAKSFSFQNALNAKETILSKTSRDINKRTSSGTTNLLYLSRIHPKKGLIYLIKAVTELSRANHKIKLIVAGPPEKRWYVRKIQNIIRENNLQKYIFFINTVCGEEKKKLFMEADIFLLLSDDDSRPLAILEAMSYGLPVIATAGCRMPEIDNKMGYIVSRNPKEIAGSIWKLAENKELAEKMGASGYRHILENFTWDKRINELMEVLGRVIAEGKA
ncbi:MAG: glycosyltransferase [Candidatus Omnitrophica bacterium]|nr:glycosyltransferase [Candidatus Omnitrophota bacterium]